MRQPSAGTGSSDVDHQSENVEVRFHRVGVGPPHDLCIVVDGDDCGALACCESREEARVAADVEHSARAELVKCLGHEIALRRDAVLGVAVGVHVAKPDGTRCAAGGGGLELPAQVAEEGPQDESRAIGILMGAPSQGAVPRNDFSSSQPRRQGHEGHQAGAQPAQRIKQRIDGFRLETVSVAEEDLRQSQVRDPVGDERQHEVPLELGARKPDVVGRRAVFDG